jgi:hypothetical protein
VRAAATSLPSNRQRTFSRSVLKSHPTYQEFLGMFLRPLTIVALALGAAVGASAATQHRKPHAKAKPSPTAVQPQQTPVVQQQPAPQPPPTPEHGPSSPPEVSLRNGQLTIVARNSTLGDVLNDVRRKTGASIDMPAPSNERVVGQFGPGAPRDVMAQLLNGSHFDYVLVGSASDPAALKKVVLTAKATGPMPTPPPNNQPTYNQNAQPPQQMEQDQQDQPIDETNTDVQPDVPPQAEQEEPQGEQPPQQPNPNGGPVVKTPEQLLRELQQQQQQQQNQQPPQQ